MRRFSNTVGCGVSNTTAMSVPVGKKVSEPVKATLLTNFGPKIRASVLSGRPSCC